MILRACVVVAVFVVFGVVDALSTATTTTYCWFFALISSSMLSLL